MPVPVTGRQFDKDGIQRMWWTEKAVETFNDRAQCFVNQYSMYEMFGIPVSVYIMPLQFGFRPLQLYIMMHILD